MLTLFKFFPIAILLVLVFIIHILLFNFLIKTASIDSAEISSKQQVAISLIQGKKQAYDINDNQTSKADIVNTEQVTKNTKQVTNTKKINTKQVTKNTEQAAKNIYTKGDSEGGAYASSSFKEENGSSNIKPPSESSENISPATFHGNYLNNPYPSYPKISRRLGEEGVVLLKVKVNMQGIPEEIILKKSSGFKRLDKAAIKSVYGWKFIPARRGNQAITSWVIVPIKFKIT